MNIFIGIGSIVEVNDGDKVLKFSLAVRQNKPCYVTCVLFEPDEQVKEFIAHLARSNQMVWIQGRVASYEFKNIRKMEIVVYGRNIKPL
ncbi:single-stranded DNA-binding protein [Desulfosudis oleivorans]|uniref:Single-strand binding protein/Primosomal replication protein n n=1 Tax=Desulfosudis oleivorans (strain DSM 6200 / JCM 39069 / Hxd3) TaxID=96561 RepID=A9A033_DESOH|nr:single-stranded DNA-binding protein [Desulfosudis oleivorans]ABW68952.1 single-strand binding protein/Primosomal replication protein n [Desulfosudis oleivorans Hxd3]